MRRKTTTVHPARTPAAKPIRHPGAEAARPKGEYRLTPTLIGVAIVIATLAAYGNLYGKQAEFFQLDDGDYVTENPHVLAGLTSESMAWALTATHAANWHPLTWWSLQLDMELFGPKNPTAPNAVIDSGGFHLTNVILHAAASVLLLVVLERMTHAFWLSAFVAALFALHPLRVESVAWISERKDVLGALFWILTMGAYAWYAQRPSLGRYAVVVASFALGLLAKPMLVTLPCALVLLDYWPLRRFGQGAGPEGAPTFARSTLPRLILEKVPLLVMSAAASAITVSAQRVVTSATLMENMPLLDRVLNAALAYVGYVGQTFWPVNLAPLYTRPVGEFPMLAGVLAAAALVVTTGLVLVFARRRPYLPVGWLWFLGTLVPVIGLVQVGIQTMADRYTYIPHIGLLMLIAWGLNDLLAGRVPRAVLAVGATAVLAACFVATYRQAWLWQSNLALWEHTVRVTTKNYGAYDNLGVAQVNAARMSRGNLAEAIAQFRMAVQIEPKFAVAHLHWGKALAEQQKWAEAIGPLREAVRLAPGHDEAQLQLAEAYMKLGRMEEALEPLAAVVRIQPDSPEARLNYALALLQRGRLEDVEREAGAALRLARRGDRAVIQQANKFLGTVYALQGKYPAAEQKFRETLSPDGSSRRMDPDSAYYLAWTLQAGGQVPQAREQYELAVKTFPNWPRPVREEAWRLATDPDPKRRNGPLALLRADVVRQALPEDPQALDTFAAALAENGRYREAVSTVQAALAQVLRTRQTELEAGLRERLRLYEQGRPYRTGAG